MQFIVQDIFFSLSLIKVIHSLPSFILYAARNVIQLLWRIFILDLILVILIFDLLSMTVIFICEIGFVLAFGSTSKVTHFFQQDPPHQITYSTIWPPFLGFYSYNSVTFSLYEIQFSINQVLMDYPCFISEWMSPNH